MLLIDGADKDFAETVERLYNTMRKCDKITLSVDSLPYTEEFDDLYRAVKTDGYEFTSEREGRRLVYRRLVNLRKQARVRTKPRSKQEQVKLTHVQVRILKALFDNPDGLSRSAIPKIADVPDAMNASLGPVWVDDLPRVEKRRAILTLQGRKLVEGQLEDRGNGEQVYYFLTDTGTEVVKQHIKLVKATV